MLRPGRPRCQHAAASRPSSGLWPQRDCTSVGRDTDNSSWAYITHKAVESDDRKEATMPIPLKFAARLLVVMALLAAVQLSLAPVRSGVTPYMSALSDLTGSSAYAA